MVFVAAGTSMTTRLLNRCKLHLISRTKEEPFTTVKWLETSSVASVFGRAVKAPAC